MAGEGPGPRGGIRPGSVRGGRGDIPENALKIRRINLTMNTFLLLGKL